MDFLNTRIKLRRLLNAWVLVSLPLAHACAPQGEISQVIHPPHQAYLERQSLGKPKMENTAYIPKGEIGLPPVCTSRKASKSSLCIDCQVDEWVIARCYSFAAEFDATNACHHTPDVTKCLVSQPPFALSIPWRASQEKFLRENFLVWRETIHSIWDEKFSPDEQVELERLMLLLDHLSLWLTVYPPGLPPEQDFQNTLEALGESNPKAVEAAKLMIQELQLLRLAGKIKLESMLDRSLAFVKGVKGDSKVYSSIQTLNIQGLDE